VQKLLLAVCFLMISSHVFAWQLRGTITEDNGDPLPYVSVYVESTTYGVASNLKGKYFLELQDGDYVIVVQMIGLETQKIPVTISGKSVVLDVVLRPSAVQLQEVTISGNSKDPAYEIIENAQKARKKYLRQYDGYSCDTYIKASLEKDLLKKSETPDTATATPTRSRMNFVESIGKTHFKQPNQVKEIKTGYNDLSEKVSSQATISISFEDDDGPQQNVQINPFLYYLTISDGDFNFYQNSLYVPRLSSTPLVSPIGGAAMLSYRYELIESFYEDGRLTYKIKVMPRNSQGALFQGHIYIVDELWSIKAVDLEINPNALSFFRDFRVIQGYEKVNDSIWVPVREEFTYNARDGKVLKIGSTLAIHSNYEINPDFPPRFFKNELKRVEDSAYEKDTLFWDEIRPITLKAEERQFVLQQDSIRLHESTEAFKLQRDSIYNAIGFWDVVLNGVGHRNTYTGTEWYVQGLIFSARPAMVGGYHHSFKGQYSKEWSRANKLETDFDLIYGFRNKDTKGSGVIAYTYKPKKFGKIYVSGGDTYDLINNYESLQSVISRSNYVQKTYGGFGHKMELFNGFYLDASVEYQDQRPITGLELAPWSEELFGSGNTPTDFERYRQTLVDVKINYVIGQKYYTEPHKKIILGSKYPKLKLHYQKGIPGIFSSDVDFDFLELNVSQELQLGTIGTSKFNVSAGKFLSAESLRFIEQKWFRGSDKWWYSDPLRSFQLLGPSINTSNAYFQANYIHHFNGALMNKIPLVRKLKLEAVGGAGILLVDDDNFRHAEVYVGVEKPFKIRKQVMKIGVYAVGADSNHSDLSATIKFGFDMYNSFTNKWSY
jgi:hypothetical protein